MQSTPTKQTDPHDVFAIETLLAAHAEKSPPLAHDPRRRCAVSVHVAPPISVGAPIPQVEPPLRAPDAHDIPAENVQIERDQGGWSQASRRAAHVQMDEARRDGGCSPCCGATAAAGWQQYGDQAKAMAVEWAPPFVLAALPSATGSAAAEQPSAPAAQASAADQVPAQQPAAAAARINPPRPPSLRRLLLRNANQLQSMAQDLATMGQQVEELKATIAQLKASQAQMARELAKASEAKLYGG